MTYSHWLILLPLSSSFFTSACAVEFDSPDHADQSANDTRVHMMPLHSADKSLAAAPPGAQLTYFGGPTLTHVNVHPVFWNSSTQFQSNLNAFYKGITNSTLYDTLGEYSQIGLGSGMNGVVDTRTTANVSDAAVQTELNRLITAGVLPAPTASNYYPVHFPAGMTITAPDGSQSCVVFCAYHGTYVRNGTNVNYGIIPDQGGGCAGGCGGDAQRVNNLDAVASHELVGATTDPAVGLATTFASPLAWYDPNNGEIADICNGLQAAVVGSDKITYTVNQVWSNFHAACVACW